MICVTGGRECDGCMACQPEPRVVFTCRGCGEDIVEGEDYYKVAGEPYCEECVSPETAEMED